MRPPAAPPLGRAVLALYPPSWRARYGDEVLALLDDSGGGPAAGASLAWHALPAWIRPPLHDRSDRMRASLATALMSWSMLTGLGLVFAQLTQLQGVNAPGHPELRWAYAVFDTTLAASALVAGLGGLPLWLLMLRRARREQRTRDMVYLLLPMLAQPGDQGRGGEGDVEDGVGPAEFGVAGGGEALQLGELGEDQAQAGQHGPGHERRGQAGPHPGRPVVQGRAEPGGQCAPGDAGRGGRAAAGVLEERQDLVAVAGSPGGRVEGERGSGHGGPPHAPAQPRRVLSRSLATEATWLIRSDC